MIKFAKKSANNAKRNDMFSKVDKTGPDLRTSKKYKEYECKTRRLYRSAVPYMTRLLNKLDEGSIK